MLERMQRVVVVAVLGGLGGCSDKDVAREVDVDVEASDTADREDAVESPDVMLDAVEVDTLPPLQGPAFIGDRGFGEVRLVAHLHSAFSHDGCDDMGLDAEGKPNGACVARLKAALCHERIGHVYMTDHPAHMNEQPWASLFYSDPPADDRLLLAADGTPWAVRFACEAGQGGPDGRVTLMVGFEGTHTMPLGLRKQIDWDRYHAFEDATPPEDLRAVTDAVTEAGGHVAIAHSEETDLSAATIASNAVSAMELYNFHANFNEVLGGGIGAALFDLEHFLDPDADVPDPNLTALILFGSYPAAALEKWRAVSAVRAITAFGGADAHENVSFGAGCKDTTACDGLAVDYPNLVAYLKVGGPVWQSDGERLDGYARVFRWVQNRVFVPAAEVSDPLAVERAFFAGRVAVVFEVLGEPPHPALIAETATGALHDLGETLTLAPGTTLWARSPDAPTPPPFSRWTDGSAAVVESIVWHTDATGSHEVARWSTPGTWQQIAVTAPGSYQLEVLITPRHLAAELGPAEGLADGTYRWVETNAIRFEAP